MNFNPEHNGALPRKFQMPESKEGEETVERIRRGRVGIAGTSDPTLSL